ncbi:MAG: DNA primase [Dysosmobacter welbionis]
MQEYLDRRKIRRATAVNFGLGASLDAWDALILAMTKKGYTKSELLEAGLAVQNRNGGLYDKFRNRLIFPVIDVRGDVVAFGGRVLDKSEPKYMNSQETPVYSKRRVLYGLNLAKKSKRSNIILCEGNIDVVTLHQAGFDNAVASMGTALTVEQTRLLSRFTKELVLCYDNDNAGKIATERALEILNNSEFSVKVLQLPRRRTEDGELVKQDADDFIKLQGKDAFEALLTGSENGIEFRMAQVAGKYDLSSDEARVAYCEEVSALLAALANPVEREIYTTRAAETAKITPEAMRLEVQRAFKRRLSREKRQELRRDLNPAVQLQPKERELRYDNIRSARAEEGILRLLIRDESLFPEEPPCGRSSSLPTAGPCLYHAVAGQGGRTRPLPGGPGGVLLPGGDEPSHRRLPAAGVSAKRTTGAGGLHTHRTDGGREAAGGGTADPLLAATEKYKDKKGTGGKQHGK